MYKTNDGQIHYEAGNKRTAIVSLSVSLSYKNKDYDLKALDLFYLREYLLRIKERSVVDFVTKKTKFNPEHFFKSIYDTDLNDYDEVIIHNSFYNTFFGGQVPDIYEKTLLELSKYKGDVWYYLIDPRFGYTDYGKYLKERMESKSKIKFALGKITTKDCERFSENITPRIKCLYAGINYNKHKEFINSTAKNPLSKEIIMEWDSIPIHEYWAANMIDIKHYKPRHRKYDIMYYGVNRKSDRNKLLNSLFKKDEELHKLWIGYDPEYSNTYVSDFLPRNELVDAMESSYTSIVAGDKLHFGNVRTLRFFESLAMNTVALIYAPYDDGILIKSDRLRGFITFDNLDDINYRLAYLKDDEKFLKEIIELQQQEFINQTLIYKEINPLKIENSVTKSKSLF